MPLFEIDVSVYFADGATYVIEAPDSDAACDMAKDRAQRASWAAPDIQEVTISSICEIAPSPPPSPGVGPLLTGPTVAAPELNAHDVVTIAMLLGLELTAQRAAGHTIDAAYLRLHAEFREMALACLGGPRASEERDGALVARSRPQPACGASALSSVEFNDSKKETP